MKRKVTKDYAAKKSFSLPGKLLAAAAAKASAFGFACFSDYLQDLIRTDLRGRRKSF